MPPDVRHLFVSPVAAGNSNRLVQGPNWNEAHKLQQGPTALLGRADNTPGQAATQEVQLDPATMVFTVDGKLAAIDAGHTTSVHYATAYGVVADGVTDNAVTLQAAVNSFPNNKGRLILPAGTILTSAQIELPATAWDSAILIEGAGKSATIVQAIAGSWAGKAVFYRGSTSVVIGGGLAHMTIIANKMADYGIFFRCGKQTIMESLAVTNAVVTEGLYGDPTVPRFYETKFIDCEFYSAGSLDPATRPDYNFRLQGYATDNEVIRVSAANAKLANFVADTGGNTFIGCHPYGSPGTQEADYCFRFNADGISAVDCYSDGFTLAGIYILGNNCAVVACRFLWPSTITGNAVRVATNRTGLAISNSTYYSKPTTALEVAYDAGLPSNSYIQSGAIRTDGSKTFLGHTTTLSPLNNGHLQVAGTDFSTASVANGRWSADTGGPFLALYKSRGATIGSNAVVVTSDQLGIIDFVGDDGAAARTGARILVRATGTPAASVMPGQFDFQTATNGTITLVSRLILDCFGNVVVGTVALATNATDGFLYIPGGPGPPTGVPRSFAGRVPLYVDTTTNKLMFYTTGAWRDAGP